MIRLQTERFVIRDLLLTDLENIHLLHSLPEADGFNTPGIPETIRTTEKILTLWLEEQNTFPRTSYVFCIELIESGQFVGLVGLKLGNAKFKVAEMWYKIHLSVLREGYALEALARLFRFAFNHLDLHRIESDCAISNIESLRVLEKLGMEREGRKRKFLPIGGEWIDSFMYGLLYEDFEMSVQGNK